MEGNTSINKEIEKHVSECTNRTFVHMNVLLQKAITSITHIQPCLLPLWNQHFRQINLFVLHYNSFASNFPMTKGKEMLHISAETIKISPKNEIEENVRNHKKSKD